MSVGTHGVQTFCPAGEPLLVTEPCSKTQHPHPLQHPSLGWLCPPGVGWASTRGDEELELMGVTGQSQALG